MIRTLFHLLSTLLLLLLLVPAYAADSQTEINENLAQANILLKIGVALKGAGPAFQEAEQLLERISVREEEGEGGQAQKENALVDERIESVQQDLELLQELYAQRFYGKFPLTRLAVPSLKADEGFVLAEQLYHAPDEGAMLMALDKFKAIINEYEHPHIVFRSVPQNRRLENFAAEILLRDVRSSPHPRFSLVNALDPAELEAFDRGEHSEQIIGRLLEHFNTVSLLVLTISQPTVFEEISAVQLHGDLYVPGEVVQGSPVDASAGLRVEDFQLLGFALDRRDQHASILISQLLLFALALIWAMRIKWNPVEPFKHNYRVLIGATLFVFGRVMSIAIITVLDNRLPEATAMIAAAWWWPAAVGLLVILGAGTAVWILQAKLSVLMPRARGARAVGSIFGLTALGTCSYFIAPIFLLNETNSWFILLPFVISSVALAGLFGFALRTGPPVPHYFAIGPLMLAPTLGLALFSSSLVLLWFLVGVVAILCLTALARHRIALARGTEEPELSFEEAAKADQQKLLKLGKKVKK